MIENFGGYAFDFHDDVILAVGIFAVFVAVPLWLLAVCFRQMRCSPRVMSIQVATYIAGGVLLLLYGWLDPGNFLEWYFD